MFSQYSEQFSEMPYKKVAEYVHKCSKIRYIINRGDYKKLITSHLSLVKNISWFTLLF